MAAIILFRKYWSGKPGGYDVLGENEPVSGDRETVGFVTSAADSPQAGCSVAIGIFKKGQVPKKVLYRNLHWKHWRIARVLDLTSDRAYF